MAIDDLRAQFPLTVLLEVAGLARSTYYDHRQRLRRPDKHANLKQAIQQAFEAAHGAYGHRRVHAVILRQGWRVAKKTVLKLMAELELRCQVRRRRRYNSYRGDIGQAATNVLNRDFTARSEHSKWVTDVSEFHVGETKIYVSPVVDLYDNRIVSINTGTSASVKMVTDGLREAIATLPPGQRPIVHSDQGFQYRHTLWRHSLRDANLTQSMSRKGNCLDNATMESVFGHLKEEWFRIQQPSTTEEFHTGLARYVHWWNTTRIQQRLGYLSPDEHRTRNLTVSAVRSAT